MKTNMRSSFLPFSAPQIDEADIRAVVKVLQSGWITTGPWCQAFEKSFAEYVGAAHACALTSATAGLHLVLKALDLKPGDEVITSSMTWVSTVNMVELAGAIPVFADIDRSTLMISARDVEPLITPRTRMIIPIHYAGAPVDLDPFRALAQKRGVLLIEDAAHAAGTEYRGVRIGASGTAIFSFHPIKNMTTGEGGMVCTNDPALIERVRRLKFHGLAKDAWDRYTQKGSGIMEVVEPGFKYNMTDMQAALGQSQLWKLDAFNRSRTKLAALYDELLQDIPEVGHLGVPAYPHLHTHHLYILFLDTERARMTRDEFVQALKERNIGTGIHFRAAHLHAYYQQTGRYPVGSLPHTEWASERLCSLPLFPSMTEDDVRDVVAAIRDVLATRRAS